MIEQFISKEVWYDVIKRVKERTDIPENLIEHWIQSPVTNDYLEGCVVGILSYTQELLRSGRTDKGYVHWLAQKTSANLFFILHQRGFKPYGAIDETVLDLVPTQKEVDALVEELLKQMGEEPPPPPEKIEGI